MLGKKTLLSYNRKQKEGENMITKILDVIVAIILIDFTIELAQSKESIAMRIIALMLMCIFLTLDKISRKLR